MKNIILFTLVFFFISINSIGQEKLVPKKIGLLYNFGNEKNFLFDDEDYFYTTRTFKGQLFYDLFDYKFLNFSLIAQPQFQSLRHQLLNEQFVRPEENNYVEKRERYTKQKNINLYALEFGFSSKVQLIDFASFDMTIGLGFSYIDETTERLAEGFTFIENLSIGFTIKTSAETNLYLGVNIGHVSNFDFQLPNDGYNIGGLEFGFQYNLK